jgi:hypothetical protein
MGERETIILHTKRRQFKHEEDLPVSSFRLNWIWQCMIGSSELVDLLVVDGWIHGGLDRTGACKEGGGWMGSVGRLGRMYFVLFCPGTALGVGEENLPFMRAACMGMANGMECGVNN